MHAYVPNSIWPEHEAGSQVWLSFNNLFTQYFMNVVLYIRTVYICVDALADGEGPRNSIINLKINVNRGHVLCVCVLVIQIN